MQHKGEIIKRAVRESGIPITKLAARMGKSRRWVYQIFENPNVSIDYILAIGKVIHHDFSNEIKVLQKYNTDLSNKILSEPNKQFANDKEEAEYWKDRYLIVLEKYNELLLKR